MHPITTLLTTLLLSTTLTSALPTSDTPSNIHVANLPRHPTKSTTDAIHPPIEPQHWTRSDKDPIHPPIHHPGAQLAARQFKWVPPHRNYLPVPEKAFKARDVDEGTDLDIERRQRVSQRSAFTPMYWKNWKRSDTDDEDSDIERRQKVAQGWVYNPNHFKPGWKRSDTETFDADSDIERRQKVAQPGAYNPNHFKPGWKRREDEETAATPHLGHAVPHMAREAPTQDTTAVTVRDVKGDEEGYVKEKREKGSDAPWANKPWWSTSSGREQSYW